MSNMVVRTNILALNSHRNLGLVGNNQARASARLSSGFRINSAADDAAGLAISEGMRAQIRGMNQAARNTQDGISLIQTAEGYLSTITELLQRARELIVQAANDTYSIDNRTTIQNEIYQLMEEIDRIADTATFNQMILFDGSIAFRQLSAQVITETLQNRNFFRGEPSAEQVQALMDWINSDSARNFVMNGSGDALEIMNGALEPLLAQFSDTPIVWDPGRSTTQFMQILIDPTSDVRDVHGQRLFDQIFWDQMDEYVRTSTRSDFHITTGVNFNGINHMLETVESAQVALRFWYAFSNQDAAGNWALNVERDELGQRFRVPDWRGPGDTVHMPGDYWDSVNTDPTSDRYGYGPDADGDGFFDGWGPWARIYSNFIGQNPRDVYERTRSGFSFAQLAVDHFLNEDIGDLVVGEFGATIRDFFSGGPLNLQVGPDSGHSIQVGIRGVSVARLGLSDLHVIDPEVGQGVVQIDQSLISAFLNDVDGALGMVSAERASLGAFQNRLEFTIENLNIAAENLSASESRIRDADMAREMMRLTQANVLQQAATAMLAQGNQAPQSILQLLG